MPRPKYIPGTTFPSRCVLEQLSPLERQMWDLQASIEAEGAHPLLTQALLLVSQAREKVADYVETLPDPPEPVEQSESAPAPAAA